MSDIKVWGGKPVEYRRMGRVEGFFPALADELTAEEQTIHWHGAKIKPWLWKGIKSFMLWSYQQFKSEAQLRLYYNDRLNRWRAMVLPQYIGTGMFSAEIPNHENMLDLHQFVREADGWYEYGTVHHHCTAGAFQSGTDHRDEQSRPGLHITLGNITSNVLDIHARYVRPNDKLQYKVALPNWIEGTPEDIGEASTASFPQVWCKQCFEKPKVVHQPYFGNQGQYAYAKYPFEYRNSMEVQRAYDSKSWLIDDEDDDDPYYAEDTVDRTYNFDLDLYVSDTTDTLFQAWIDEYWTARSTEAVDEAVPKFLEDLDMAEMLTNELLSTEVRPLAVLALAYALLRSAEDLDIGEFRSVKDAVAADLKRAQAKTGGGNGTDNSVSLAGSLCG